MFFTFSLLVNERMIKTDNVRDSEFVVHWSAGMMTIECGERGRHGTNQRDGMERMPS